MYRIGIDVGGTFTDVTLLNSETGAYYPYKLSSTLHDQSEATGQKKLWRSTGSRWSSWSILATAPRLQPT